MGLRSTIDDNYYFIVLQTAAKCFLVFSGLCPLLSILFLIVIFVDTSIFYWQRVFLFYYSNIRIAEVSPIKYFGTSIVLKDGKIYSHNG